MSVEITTTVFCDGAGCEEQLGVASDGKRSSALRTMGRLHGWVTYRDPVGELRDLCAKCAEITEIDGQVIRR